MNFTFFSSAHGTFSSIDHILGHQSSLGKFKKIEIIPSIFSDHNAVRLDLNYRRKTIKNSNIWRLNNRLLNNQQITEEVKKQIKICLEMNVFLELSCFFDDPADVGNLISGCSAFSKTAWTSGSSWFTYCWSLAWRILSITLLSVWDECNCAVVWAFFGIAFFRDWNENWPFPVLWPLLSFPNLLAYWVHHFHSIIF